MDTLANTESKERDLDPGIEYVCVIIRVKGVRLGLCVVYRPACINYTRLDTLFHDLFVDLAMEVHSVICVGDINVNMLSKIGSGSKYLRRLLKESNAAQVINELTRVTASSATLLDHVIVDKSFEVKKNGVTDAPQTTEM
ncbi:hypothetical protein J6590_045164 [Homalodisca vitripennis]|nr:hypothetical protein J6590_045164 [Homalodisca vitripennis]